MGEASQMFEIKIIVYFKTIQDLTTFVLHVI